MLYRIKDIHFPKGIKTVYIAAGTNNIFSDSVEAIVDTLIECVNIITEKNKTIEVFVQGILPRLHVNKACQFKIMELNKELKSKFGKFYVDVQAFTCDQGSAQKRLYYKDGIHLSTQGCQNLAKLIQGVLTEKIAISTVVENIWTTKYDRDSMCIPASIGGLEVSALIDTGASVSIMSKKVFDRLENVTLEKTSLKNLIGVTGASRDVLGIVNVFVNFGQNGFHVRTHVVEGIKGDMILGRDTMDKRVHCIVYGKGLISFNHTEKNTKFQEKVQCFLNGTYIMEPNSTREIEIQTEQIFVKMGTVVECSQELVGQGIIIPKKLVEVKNGKGKCLAYNITSSKKKLSQGIFVAKIA